MARITSVETAEGFVVTIVGRLTARDLRRLERVCGPAVERRRPFRVMVEAGGSIDRFARAYLERLRTCGTVVEGDEEDKAALRS